MMYRTDLYQVIIWNVWLSLFKKDHRDYGQEHRKAQHPAEIIQIASGSKNHRDFSFLKGQHKEIVMSLIAQ